MSNVPFTESWPIIKECWKTRP